MGRLALPALLLRFSPLDRVANWPITLIEKRPARKIEFPSCSSPGNGTRPRPSRVPIGSDRYAIRPSAIDPCQAGPPMFVRRGGRATYAVCRCIVRVPVLRDETAFHGRLDNFDGVFELFARRFPRDDDRPKGNFHRRVNRISFKVQSEFRVVKFHVLLPTQLCLSKYKSSSDTFERKG